MIALNFVEIRKLLDQVFGPSSKFKVGDSVEILRGGELMVVVEVLATRESKGPRMLCQWVDSKTKRPMKELFSEDEIKLIDWYKL